MRDAGGVAKGSPPRHPAAYAEDVASAAAVVDVDGGFVDLYLQRPDHLDASAPEWRSEVSELFPDLVHVLRVPWAELRALAERASAACREAVDDERAPSLRAFLDTTLM